MISSKSLENILFKLDEFKLNLLSAMLTVYIYTSKLKLRIMNYYIIM